MGTPFSSVIDLALVSMQDYKLDALAKNNPNMFEQVMINYLVKSVPKFVGCLTPLDYDLSTSSFNNELSSKEMDILADYLILTWWEEHNNDVLVYTEVLRDADFNRYATGQNMARRIETVDGLREKVRQDVTDYQMSNDHLSMLMGV